MNFCTGCGAPLRAGAAFCTKCGRTVPGTNPAVPPTSEPARTTSDPISGPGFQRDIEAVETHVPSRPAFDEQTEQPPASPPGRRGPMVLAGVLATLLVAGGLWWAVGRDTDDSSTEAPRVEATRATSSVPVAPLALDRGSSLLSEPTTAWTLEPGDLGLKSFAGKGAAAPQVLGDLIVVDVGTNYVALDSATGKERWRYAPKAAWSYCWALATVMACGTDGNIEVVDSGNGKVTARIPVSDPYGAYAETPAGLVHAYGTSERPSVELLSLSSLSQRWNTRLADPSPRAKPHRGPHPTLRLGDGVVEVKRAGVTWTVDLSTGRELESYEATSTPTSYRFLKDRWEYRTTQDKKSVPQRTIVRDADGVPLLTAPGAAWNDPPAPVPGVVGVGGALYDESTGEPLWDRSDIAPNALGWWASGGQFVKLTEPGAESSEFVEANSGQTVTTQRGDRSFAGTGDALAVVTRGGTLEVYDGEGELAWNRPVPVPLKKTDEMRLITLGNALVSLTPESVTGFSGFTSASGAAADPGTSWTDCGADPLFSAREVALARGGVQVEFEVTSSCPGGTWLSWHDLLLSWEAPDGTTLAAASFDFGQRPAWIPTASEQGAGRRIGLVFPFSGTNTDLTALQRALNDSTPTHVNTMVTEEFGRSDVPPLPDSTTAAVLIGTSTADDTGASASGVDEAAALTALRTLAAADAGQLDSEAEGHWVPRLAARTYQPGGSGDTARDILSEHLRLRARHRQVRLLASAEWSSVPGPEAWVSVALSPTTDPAEALAFCRENAFTNACVALRLERQGPSQGATQQAG